MKFETAVFITNSAWNKRDEIRYGIEVFHQRNIDVLVLDCTEFLRPGLSQTYCPPDPVKVNYTRKINSWEEYEDTIKNMNSNTIFFPLVYKKKIYNILRKYDLLIAGTFRGAVPSPTANVNKENIYQRSLRLLRSPMVFGYKIINRIINVFNSMQTSHVDYFFYGGKQDWENCHKYRDSKSKCVPIHALDYDIYLENKGLSVCENKIVFLDEFMPFHPDYFENPIVLDPESYYKKITKLFKRLEDIFGIPVIVAAHPRSNYDAYPKYFKEFKIIRGDTFRLISQSKLVLAHASAGLSFANLFSKPVLFLTSNNIKKSSRGSSIEAMAIAFGKCPLNLDTNYKNKLRDEMNISAEHYKKYRQNYIKMDGSQDCAFWEIVINTILNRSK